MFVKAWSLVVLLNTYNPISRYRATEGGNYLALVDQCLDEYNTHELGKADWHNMNKTATDYS